MKLTYLYLSTLSLGMLFGASTICSSAYALTANQACRQQFEAAKKANTLNNQTYSEFKAANCKDLAATKTESATKESTAKTDQSTSSNSQKSAAAVAPVAAGAVVFPDKISSKYAQEKEGPARMHTCLDQYHANKPTGKNGELKWIQKGGGYYSECVKHLKGEPVKK